MFKSSFQGSATSAKGQIENIFHFKGHLVSVPATQHERSRRGYVNDGHSHVPIKLYSQAHLAAGFGPWAIVAEPC
jgi:hypothetical protein